MNKIAIIGPPGSGKTTLAKKLSKILHLPLIHLDRHFLHGKWQVTPTDAWNKKVKSLAAKTTWIIDGDYFSSMDIRLNAADIIIFLNIPRFICLWRITKRMLTASKKPLRSDLPTECIEKLNRNFITFFKFVWQYHSQKKPVILQKLEKYKSKKQVFILTNQKDIDNLIKHLKL
jgi:adenylate kinase family enzyme